MNFCVEFQPVPPNSWGQLGQSQPLPVSFFCHGSSRSLETWLDRLRRLSSATSGGMLAVIQSRTSRWKVSSDSLKARRIVVPPTPSAPSGHLPRLTGEEKRGRCDNYSPPLSRGRCRVLRGGGGQSPHIAFAMIPRCTSDEP